MSEIRRDVLDARFSWEVYRTYAHARTRRKYGTVLNWYGNFFSCSQQAHFAAMVVALGRVFDQNSKNIGICKLLRTCPDLERTESRKLNRARDIWKEKAMILRHGVLAHHSAGSSPHELFIKADISLNDIGRLIGLCERLVDAWSRKLGNDVTILSGAKGDLVALLDALLRASTSMSRR